jgi:hypothetical protein
VEEVPHQPVKLAVPQQQSVQMVALVLLRKVELQEFLELVVMGRKA